MQLPVYCSIHFAHFLQGTDIELFNTFDGKKFLLRGTCGDDKIILYLNTTGNLFIKLD